MPSDACLIRHLLASHLLPNKKKNERPTGRANFRSWASRNRFLLLSSTCKLPSVSSLVSRAICFCLACIFRTQFSIFLLDATHGQSEALSSLVHSNTLCKLQKTAVTFLLIGDASFHYLQARQGSGRRGNIAEEVTWLTDLKHFSQALTTRSFQAIFHRCS